MRQINLLLIAIVFFGSALISLSILADATDNMPMIGENAPDFRLPSIEGEWLSLKSLRGNYVIMHFGTSW